MRALCIACYDFRADERAFYQTKRLAAEFVSSHELQIGRREQHPEPWVWDRVYVVRPIRCLLMVADCMYPERWNMTGTKVKLIKPLRRVVVRWLRRLGWPGEEWQAALPAELQFWEKALTDPDRHWLRVEYEERTNRALEFQDRFKALINAPPGAVVRVLDVGAGPLTRLGKIWPDRTLQLFPIDPLAREYKQLFQRLKFQPPVWTEIGEGERLLEKFAKNYFDLAYASNSLDHSRDPLRAIEQMFSVVKPHCYVYLWHFAHVGVTENYSNLHQWNFDLEHGDMILSDGRGTRHELAKVFHSRGELNCEFESFAGCKVVVGKLKKLVAD
jgi:SAM-dependent methyltransferase